MKREILALVQQVRTLCMLAHAAGACVTLLHSLGILDVACVRAVLSLILVSTIALCGVLLCTKRHVLEISAEYRGIIGKCAIPEHDVPEKVYGNEIKVLVGFMLRDTVAVIASLGLVSVLISSLGEVGQLVPVATVAIKVSCVLLLLNYIADAVLRAAFLVMGAYSACSRCTASLGDHEHGLLCNVSTSLRAMRTTDTFLRG